MEEVLNRNNPSGLPHIQEASEDLDINLEAPSKEEIVRSIPGMKNYRPQTPSPIWEASHVKMERLILT